MKKVFSLTAFTVGPLGFYECIRMLLFIDKCTSNIPKAYEILFRWPSPYWCIIYPDDIIIFSKDPDDHITRLEGVFEKLAQAGLKLKPSKCEFFEAKLKYLGHVVSPDGIATDPAKIEVFKSGHHPR